MKKILLTICLAIMVFVPISAQKTHGINYLDNGISDEYFTTEKAEHIENSPQVRAISKTLYITRLAQADSRWADEKLGTCNDGKTIGSHGCTLTAATMVYNYLTNSMITPSDMNKELGSFCNLSWTAIPELESIKFASVSNSSLLSVVTSYIDADLPLILTLRKYEPSSSYADEDGYRYHFVVVNGYNSSINAINLKDPGGNNYTTFAAALNNGWNAYQYRVLDLK